LFDTDDASASSAVLQLSIGLSQFPPNDDFRRFPKILFRLDIFEKEKARSPIIDNIYSIFLKKKILNKNCAFSISKIFFTKVYVIGLIADNYKLTGLKWVMAIAAIA
jgi:hypothetical protein